MTASRNVLGRILQSCLSETYIVTALFFFFENNVVSAETSIMDEVDTNELLTTEIREFDIQELIDYYYCPLKLFDSTKN